MARAYNHSRFRVAFAGTRGPKALALALLKANVDLQHKLGFVKAPIDVKKYADFSITKEAAEQLAAGQ